MARRLAVTAVILAAGGALFFGLSRIGGSKADSQPAAPPLPATASVPEPGAASGKENPEGVPQAGPAQPQPAGPAAEDAERGAFELESFVLEVLDGATSKPAAGAKIAVLDFKDLAGIEESADGYEAFHRLDLEALLDHRGTKYAAGEDGRVALPALAWEAVIGARSGGSWGLLRLVATPLCRAVLRIYPDRFVRIRVKEHDGSPACGAALRIVRQSSEGREDVVWKGLASRTHGIALARNIDRDRKKADSDRYEIWPAMPVATFAPVAVNPFDPPADPYEVVLPPTGTVSVLLVDGEGRPFDGRAAVTLSLRGDDPDEYYPDLRHSQGWAVSEKGKAVFERVEPGYELSAFALCGIHGEERARSPSEPGARLSVTMTVFPDPDLSGRIVDEKGLPIRSGRLKLEMEIRTASGDTLHLHETPFAASDGAGRFRIRVPGPSFRDESTMQEEPLGCVLRVTGGPDVSVQGIAKEMGAEIEVPQFRFGGVDLGDIRMEQSPFLAAGKVVDSKGAPVPGASVMAASQSVMAWYTRSSRARLDFQEAMWKSLTAVADEDGNFEIHMKPARDVFDENRMAVIARKDGFLECEPAAFDPGEQDLRLVLARGGGIRGGLVLPRGLRRKDVWIRISGLDTGFKEDGGAVFVRPESDGAFAHAGLPPGNAVVHVGAGDDPMPILSVGLSVAEGATAADPRLASVDLVRTVRRVSVLVRDRAGNPIEGSCVTLAGLGGKYFYTDRFGLASFVSGREEIGVEIQKAGFRKAFARITGRSAEAELQASLKAKLILECGMRLPDPPVRIVCMLTKPGFYAEKSFHPGESGKVIEFDVPSAGAYAVRLRVDRINEETGEVSTTGDIAGVYPATIEVRDAEGAQDFRIEIAPDALGPILEHFRD